MQPPVRPSKRLPRIQTKMASCPRRTPYNFQVVPRLCHHGRVGCPFHPQPTVPGSVRKALLGESLPRPPPLTQCRNCWRFDHSSNNCKEQQRCRLCSGLHDEASHPFTDPTSCQRCTIANENGDFMDTADEGRCPHDLRCLNCLGKNNEHNHPADARRCPARIERYGTARDNERRAQKASNPWSSVKPKKPNTKAPTSTLPPNPAPALPSPNRFDALALEPTFPNPLPDANALINFES